MIQTQQGQCWVGQGKAGQEHQDSEAWEEGEGGLAGSCSMLGVNRALGRATEPSRRPVRKLQ